MKRTRTLNLTLVISIIISIFCSYTNVFANDTKHEEASKYITEAYSALSEKNYDRAVEYCNKAISIIPEPVFYSLKASALKHQGKYDAALTVLDEALKVSPQYTEAYMDKAEIYTKLEKYSEAIQCYDNGISKNPKHIALYMYKSILLNQLGKSNEAIECYRDGISKNPKEIALYSQLSYQLFKTGKTDEILKCLKDLIKIDPYHEEALYNIACTYSIKNDKDNAILYLKKAIELAPHNRIYAVEEKDFNNIKNSKEFKALTTIGVYVDGKNLEFDVLPTIENGRLLLPLRVVFECMGASVEWITTTKTVKGKKGDTDISLQIGSKTAYVKGKEVSLDVSAKIIDGRTLVPVRFVSESFGANVEWDKDTKTVYVTSKDEAVNNTGLDSNAIIQKLKNNIDGISIDGLFPNPYGLETNEAKVFLVAKSKDDLNLFNALSKEEKLQYLNDYVQDNYGSYVGCDTIYTSFVYDAKMYYSMETTYEAEPEELESKSYKLGMPVNVVVQDVHYLSYRYYYGE